MEVLLLILFVLSIPVFYILGAIDFFKTIMGKKKNLQSLSRADILELTQAELNKFLKHHPKAKAIEFFEYLKNEHLKFNPEINTSEYTEKETTHHAEVIIAGDTEEYQEEPEKEERQDEERYHKRVEKDLWENWYKENSINLLLYIGAFFIVSSASIFVGFQWESIGQELKALLLTLLTTAFLGSGFFFFQNPKVKNAGLTFSAIGSLLIPLTGVGWYNFVLKEQGISFGLTWFITSIIAIAIYIALGLFFKNKFYGYITSLALWSLSLSFVSLANLDVKFYILASILSNFFILAFHLVTKDKNEDIRKVFAEPLEISTTILMPLTLFFGLFISLSENMFYSMEVAISLFLASCYYYLYYSFSQKIWQLAVSETIFPIFLISVFGWQKASDYRLFYTEIILGFADLGISFIMLKNKLEKPALVSTTIGTIIAVLSFVSILGAGYGAIHSLTSSIMLIGFGAVAFFVHRKYELLHISTVAALFAVYFFFKEVIGLQNKEYLLGIIYLIIGGASFVTTWLLKDSNKPQILVSLVLAALGLALGFIFSITNQYTILTSLITYAAVFFAASFRFKNTDLIFLSNLFLSLSLYQIIRIFEIAQIYQPFIFITLAIALYLLSTIFSSDENRQNRYKLSGLTLSLITPLFFGAQSFFDGGTIERSALITGYISTILFVYEYSKNETQNIRMATIGISLITALWQFKFLPASDYYTLACSLITALIILFTSFTGLKNPKFVLLSNLFIILSIFQIISIYKIEQIYQPFIFALLAIGFYLVHFILNDYEDHQNQYKISGLIIGIVNPIFFGLLSGYSGTELERSSLISAYLTTVLFGFEASRNRNEQFRYFSSAVAIITILWQIKFLQFTELQLYAIPLGIYFLLLGYSRKLKDDKSGEELLNVIGIATLLLTSIAQSFGENSAPYALVLGIEGILFLLLGISTNNKLFRYAGIAGVVLAVLSQTYSYLFSLPRWLITGLAGIIFLAVAVFLLIKRKPEEENSKE